MKTVSAGTLTELQNSYDVLSSLRLTAEWNQNRYSPIASVTNGSAASPIEDADPDNFPVESIVLPDRPGAGILKNRASSTARAAFAPDGYVTKGYISQPNGPRYVTCDPDAKYKYWSSPAESAGVSVANSPSAIANVTPTVIYTNPTWTNKIVVQLENSYAQPTAWTVQVTTDGTNWTTIATNPTIPSNGRVELWRQANTSWTSTPYYDNPLQIRGVRLNVTQMNRSKVFFNLIELGARLESDLSPWLISYDSNFSLSDHSFITPLGQTSANTASVVLSNVDNRFSNDNPSSLYYGLIDKNVEMRLDLGISTDAYSTLNKTYEWIRQFTMRVDEWSGQDLDEMTASLQDDSMLLQAIKPNPTLWQNMTVAEIVWRLLDAVGYSKYFVDAVAADAVTMIPFFWTDGTETIWDIFKKLGQATQTAIYFDEYGIMRIKTRNSALDLTATSKWTFDAVKNGSKLPDVIDVTKTNNYEANTVNIAYQETKLSEEKSAIIPMESVWEPGGDMVLRASALSENMTVNSTSFRINPADIKVWPYEGVMQIEGEFIRFKGKWYNYYLANGTMAGKWVMSADEKAALDKLNQYLSYRNYFSGYFAITKRGEYNSVAKTHVIDATGYNTRYRNGSGTVRNWSGGWKALPGTSTAKITTNKTFSASQVYTVTRGQELDVAPNYFGARVRFPTTGYTHGIGGFTFGNSTNESGYFFELYQTPLFTTNPTARNSTNELAFYVKNSAGTVTRLGPNGKKGVATSIVRGVWYDLDITANWNYPGGPLFVVYLNGFLQFSVQVPTALKPSVTPSGRWGVFTRGFTNMDVEYVYATNATEQITFDNSSLYSKIHGGYQSTQLNSEWIYNSRKATRMVGKKRQNYIQRYNQLVIDDFGGYAHEVREMNVKFDPAPVMHSRLYWSNTEQVVCPEYNANPFEAKFIMANATRRNAIVNGSDKITYGADNSVEQKALIYGRTINQEDEKIETVKDDAAILRRGEVTVDFPATFIQSKNEAQELGRWITKHWAGGQDEIEIESFMNPLLQIGDLVSVNHPLGNMAPSTHKYFVVEMKHSFDSGMTSTFTLRRARI